MPKSGCLYDGSIHSEEAPRREVASMPATAITSNTVRQLFSYHLCRVARLVAFSLVHQHGILSLGAIDEGRGV